MNDPRFSIIIMNYNYEPYLTAAIDSALSQSYPNVETIVVDDASTDGSTTLIAGYGASVIPVLRARNGGMSAAANSGYAKSTGDWLVFLDADDVLYKDAIETLSAARQDITAQVQARLDLIDAAGARMGLYPSQEVRLASGDVRAALTGRGRYQTTVTSGLAFARKALEHVMPIPEREFERSADGYLTTVAPLFGPVVALDRSIGAYRRHANNHSSFGASLAQRARWRVDHDEARYAALRRLALPLGVAVSPRLGMDDTLHLEERLASLCFDPAAHPHREDQRFALGWAGMRAAWGAPLSFKRRAVLSAIFLIVAVAPIGLARALLAWKMEKSSRPAFIDATARLLRKGLG